MYASSTFFSVTLYTKDKAFIEFPGISWTNLYSYLLLALLLKTYQTFLLLLTRKSNYISVVLDLFAWYCMVILALF